MYKTVLKKIFFSTFCYLLLFTFENETALSKKLHNYCNIFIVCMSLARGFLIFFFDLLFFFLFLFYRSNTKLCSRENICSKKITIKTEHKIKERRREKNTSGTRVERVVIASERPLLSDDSILWVLARFSIAWYSVCLFYTIFFTNLRLMISHWKEFIVW